MYYGERLNSISHLVALFLSVSGVSVLMTLAVQSKDPWKIGACLIFGLCTIFLYGFSTLYHSLQGIPKKVFQKLDYIAIYLMIAGTYTPLTLITLRQEAGSIIFLVIWALAIVGILQELFRKASPQRKLSLFLYVVMGWLILTVIKELIHTLPLGALISLALGGVFYTAGILFFLNDHRWKHAHGIWHLFVMAGSTCHYFLVLFWIV